MTKPSPGRLVGWLMLLASLLALGMSSYTSYQTRENARCQATWNDVQAERTRILTDVGADERAAERRAVDLLFGLLLDPAATKPADERSTQERQRINALYAEVLEAAAARRTERANADRARAANPVPPPPSQTCG